MTDRAPDAPPDRYSRERLFDAARRGDVGAMRAELSLRGRRKFPKTLGEAALEAIRGGHALAAAFLLDHGAEVKWGLDQALVEAAREGRLDCCSMLIDRGADVGYNRQTPLREAALRGQLETVRLLLDRGASNDGAAPYMAALAHASGQRRFDVVALLLDRGATLGRDAALMLAARSPEGLPTMRRLIAEGGEAIRPALDSALHYALEASNAAAAKLLVDHGAKLQPARAEFEAGLESAKTPRLNRLLQRAEREEGEER